MSIFLLSYTDSTYKWILKLNGIISDTGMMIMVTIKLLRKVTWNCLITRSCRNDCVPLKRKLFVEEGNVFLFSV